MKFRILVALLLAFTLGCSHKATAPQPVKRMPAIERQHSTTHRVGVYKNFYDGAAGGHCSGTAIGRHAILTAQHCFHNSNLILLDDNKLPIVIMAALIDGHDHVIYLVKYDFAIWSEIDQRNLVAKEPVHFWGAPGYNSDVYRTGYFVQLDIQEDVDSVFMFQKFILPTFKGDSGSGVFDENGKIVAVISLADDSANELSAPLQFTDEQLDMATEE